MAQILSHASHPLLFRRSLASYGATRTALRQTRGESNDDRRGSTPSSEGRGRRTGSGGIPNVDLPGGPNLRAMYLGQLLSGFADRMWEFSVPFFLLALNRPDSMALAILYAVFAGVANVAGGPVIGYFVDKYPRLRTISFCLVMQSALVLFSFLIIRTALSLSASSSGTIAALVGVLTLTSSAASLASLASTHAIERDWIRCLNRYEDEGIRRSDRVLRGIGIGCRVGAPLCVGKRIWGSRGSV
jgi:hypothetical protein